MAVAKKSMAPKRKGKKQYALVTFEFDLFEGEFTLPKLSGMPVGILAGLDEGEVFKFKNFLDEHAPGMSDAVLDLDGEEFGDFMKAWADASGDDSGKSNS